MDFDDEGRMVDFIEAEHQMKGQTVCCQEVFKLWLKGPDATWGNLIELLIDCEQTALAEKVKDALGLQSVQIVVDVTFVAVVYIISSDHLPTFSFEYPPEKFMLHVTYRNFLPSSV